MLEYERIALSRLLARIAPYPWRYLDSKLLNDGTEIGVVFIHRNTGEQTSRVFDRPLLWCDEEATLLANKAFDWLDGLNRKDAA